MHHDGVWQRPAARRAAGDQHHVQRADRSRPLQTPQSLTARILLSCGEPSGDLYAGALTRELRAIDRGVTVEGLGGPQFADAGGRLLDDYRGFSVTGLTEAIRTIPRAWATLRRLVAAAQANRPDVAVAIDFPDFNFPLARQLKRLGVPVVYYVSPQIWAWRPGRLKTIREIADLVLVIFPFEEKIYRDAGVPVEFVGHPLVDLARARDSKDVFLQRHRLSPRQPTVAMLPGSRANEVRRILPTLVAAAGQIRARVPDAQFVIARAPNLNGDLFKAARTPAFGPLPIVEEAAAGIGELRAAEAFHRHAAIDRAQFARQRTRVQIAGWLSARQQNARGQGLGRLKRAGSIGALNVMLVTCRSPSCRPLPNAVVVNGTWMPSTPR
ncbi:MAG: lipid-A-disaccharide synthase [Acidobacteria bacterium]|nr:MAG: lipid-A-disaccharide synthase [Acidobacteriota bacterium]